MSSSSVPWTRYDWNNIIQDVNDQIESCGGEVPPLSEVSPNHKWSVGDIVAVRNKLIEICDDPPSFSAPLSKWTTEMVDELENAINDCLCEGCNESTLDGYRAIDGNEGTGFYPTVGDPTWGGYWDEKYENFYPNYSQSYSWLERVGQIWFPEGIIGINITCRLRFGYFYWNGSQIVWTEDETTVGSIISDCNGMIVSAPSGVFYRTFPVNSFPFGGGISGFTYWDTAGVACC